jgi:hypothetical protein
MVHETEVKRSDAKRGRGRPKTNISLASRAMNYVQVVSQFPESNQGMSLYNLCSQCRFNSLI